MPRLDYLTVRGFKSIHALEDFELRSLNVLIGANGAGKSNLLNLFRMLANLSQKRLQLFIKDEGGPDALLFGGQRVFRYLRKTLRERPDTYVTTFFDLYSLPRDFPGRKETMTGDPLELASEIEAGFHEAVVREAKCHPERFFSHVQPYEFESLLFSDTTSFIGEEPRWRAFADNLAAARRGARSPEHINDGANTHPSARLRNLLQPGYKKVAHGVEISTRIGIDRIRTECRHFNRWLAHIENLAPLRPEA